jgi:hypothetical protein
MTSILREGKTGRGNTMKLTQTDEGFEVEVKIAHLGDEPCGCCFPTLEEAERIFNMLTGLKDDQ